MTTIFRFYLKYNYIEITVYIPGKAFGNNLVNKQYAICLTTLYFQHAHYLVSFFSHAIEFH